MRADLEGLEITKAELEKLSEVNVDKKNQYSKLVDIWICIFFLPCLFAFWLILTAIAVAIDPSILANSSDDSIYTNPFEVIYTVLLMLGVIPAFILSRKMGRAIDRANQLKSMKTINSFKKEEVNFLIGLLKDVEKFNSIVKAIDVSDQLEEAGNKGMSLSDRNKAVDALKLARQDLVRALKTERILRNNQGVINTQPELFANNLSSLRTLQVSSQATEYSELLNSALQIAVNVQEEMIKLHNR